MKAENKRFIRIKREILIESTKLRYSNRVLCNTFNLLSSNNNLINFFRR